MVDEQRDDQEVVDQRELERALAVLRPAGSQIDRDRFLFLAGQASAGGGQPNSGFSRWIWPGATLISSVAAVVLSVLLLSRPEPGRSGDNAIASHAHRRPAPTVADTPVAMSGSTTDPIAVPTADETARALAEQSNSPRLRSFVLAYGINALPEPAPIPSSASDSDSATDDEPRTPRALLRQTLKQRAAKDPVTGSAG
ncbi:MAG TPA: hypothetical protein VGP63_11140 [Planctomycetaceae bacterium]|jgi:hypothetical protein|nr:hypothetical protein [Planctomycetaceae bacterium]